MNTCCTRCRGEDLVVSNLAELPDITLCMACGARVELSLPDRVLTPPVHLSATSFPAY